MSNVNFCVGQPSSVGWEHAQRRAVQALLVIVFLLLAASPAQTATAAPPQLQEFGCGNIFEDYWILFGTIEDEDPEGCIIGFGGVLDGYYCSVESDGTFALVVWLPPTTEGMATAQALNYENLVSNVAEFLILQY